MVRIYKYHQAFLYLRYTYVRTFSCNLDHICRRSLLIKKWLKDDDFIPRFYEAHESAEHPFVGTSSDGHFRVWIDLSTEKRRVGISQRLFQPWSTLCSISRFRNTAGNAIRAFVGEYWLHSTLSRASLAASVTNFGGL